MVSDKNIPVLSTKDMIKFWVIGMLALIITGFIVSIIFFGFVASTFGG